MNDKTILATIAVVGASWTHAAWAQQPELRAERPQAVWTPSAQAPEGTLSHALEGQRHDHFIDLAQKEDIELVFFGTTETEMWSWAERGRAVWDRELAGRKAANFGSQGTNPKSLLWRMQNGELDGFEAKLVVLQLGSSGRISDPFSPGREPELVAGWASIIAEIRARQPQAKILLTAAIPRGIPPRDSRQSWQEIADANAAALAQLTDDETVFYADFGERFFLTDGSYDHDFWGMPGPAGVGIQPAAYEVLAEELEPWVDRFVR